MTCQRLFSFVLFLFVSAPVWADGLPQAPPGNIGLSAERLARITKTIEADVAEGRIPGAVALIARDGKIGYFKAIGQANRETGQPMAPDTIFRIYSMSKPITSVALMMLYEEGLFRLKDPVSKYLPELKGLKVLVEKEDAGDAEESSEAAAGSNPDPAHQLVEAERDMTVQDLLRHTSGLTYGFFGDSIVDQRYKDAEVISLDQTIGDMVGKLSEIPLKHQPGTTWEYSVSVDVIGRLVEVLSGQRFDRYLQERIFEPLGMTDTAFIVPEEKRGRFAQLYSPKEDGGLKVTTSETRYWFTKDHQFFSGGGGLTSTITDYLRFCQMMLNGGELDGVRLLSRKTVNLMTIDHLEGMEGRPSPGYGFGLGFAVAKDLSRTGVNGSVGEYNWGGAAGTRFWIDPEERMIGIYMVQILPHTNLHYGETFKVLAYQAIAD